MAKFPKGNPRVARAKGGGHNQDVDEKKDHFPDRGRRSEDMDFEDPQANQSKGRPKHIPHPSGHPSQAGVPHSEPNPPTDNTVPGGNRRKGSNVGRLDHG
ncbi:MAG TPA: hypothetical protein VFB38_09185 [Chthonomonadaceae bacterium]|nr:hypothetical protein [Chthonomonadaceae bacterium]